MEGFNNFKNWAASYIIQNFAETALTFGRHKGQDISTIPAGYLQWALDNVANLHVSLRKEIEDSLRNRRNKPQINIPKINIPQQAEPKKWILASVIKDYEYMQTGEKVVLSKTPQGNWDYITAKGSKGVISNTNVPLYVKSDRDAHGQQIIDINPEKLLGTPPVLPSEPLKQKELKPNPYQEQIIKTFQETDKNIVISALAGTGKTTTLRRLAALKKPSEKWLYLVFNKKNQVEATRGKSPFPLGIDVKTTHSFLGSVLGENSKAGRFPQTDIAQTEKLSSLLDSRWFEEKALDLNPKLKYYLWPLKTRVKKLAQLAKSFALHPQQNITSQLEQLIGKYRIDVTLIPEDKQQTANENFTKEIIELTMDVLDQSMPYKAHDSSLHNTRDHDDTLWYAATHADELHWPHYDVVLADEVQDFNNAQMVMIKKLQEAGARIIAVGDKNQSIYMFRGADSSAFSNVENLLNNFKNGSETLTLPINWRSGKNIIDYSNQATHVKNLQAGLDHAGEVSDHQTYPEVMDSISSEWNKENKLKMQTAFIARTNKPLVHTAMNLLKNNIPFVIIGRDFAEDIIKFIRKITGSGRMAKNYNMDNFLEALANYKYQKEAEFKGKTKKEAELQEIRESTEALQSVLDYLQEQNWHDSKTGLTIRNSEDFINYLKKVFKGLNVNEDAEDAQKFESIDPKKIVSLTTAHRSKGLEFERVYIVRNDLFPHPSAKSEEELDQEKNMQYVSYTRATHELHVINDTEPGGKRKE
jgi:superfamily I DNA/RNA helicase